MSYAAEGELYIPLEDFRKFARKYLPDDFDLVIFGVPKVISGDQDITVSFATGSDGNDPSFWGEKPKALKEWEDLENVDER